LNNKTGEKWFGENCAAEPRGVSNPSFVRRGGKTMKGGGQREFRKKGSEKRSTRGKIVST